MTSMRAWRDGKMIRFGNDASLTWQTHLTQQICKHPHISALSWYLAESVFHPAAPRLSPFPMSNHTDSDSWLWGLQSGTFLWIGLSWKFFSRAIGLVPPYWAWKEWLDVCSRLWPRLNLADIINPSYLMVKSMQECTWEYKHNLCPSYAIYCMLF